MIDEPDATTLLDAMAATLTEQVVPATSGGAQHAARVVANLCGILARQLLDEGPGYSMLVDRAGRPAPFLELVGELDAEIQTAADPEQLAEILALLLADARHRAEIAKPGYTGHDAEIAEPRHTDAAP